MKKSFLLLVMLAGLFFFSGCNKDDDGKSNFYIKAKINGNSYSADVGTLISADRISVSGVSRNDNESHIMISFPTDVAVGTTYELSDDVWLGDYEASYWDNSGNHYPSNSGSITITQYNTARGLIKGTFRFNVEGYAITDGEFYAELP